MDSSQKIKEFVDQAQSIVITSHKSPDGDSIGSSLALYHLLKKWGKNVQVVHPDPAPEFLHWVPGQLQIIDFERKAEQAISVIQTADLIFCLDYNEPSRVGDQMQPYLLASGAAKVMIDHHLHPTDFCQVIISETAACSTCELVYKWLSDIQRLDDLDETSGTCIYLGIMTDTGSFRFPSVTASTHEIIADLIRRGVKHYLIHEAVYDTNTVDRIKLRGFALSEKLVCLNDIHVAYASLSEEELKRYNYQKGDTEGLVNQILGIQGIKMAVLFVEKDGKVKISFRAKGDYFVNLLAKTHFEGGGHAYASGGISSESLEKTVGKFVTFVKDFIPKT
ncbi:DHH family phosphoesterase [Fluviicola chungangensis]|uniref:Bifunctional oligoribonuclease/PAP phosphatase NrnA n=1 Tax=Fluviicola chungangensis TaxID=2597671 RepID=A0A556N7X3_9FLAO|nr:bifunctional oligoribonuclease/PAP phosphatase NrnA [Fluviicola chungangensis]TSJ48230.1 bifunctional oligoribonuclease/PAP phosphatase NrnA [Fluviicola chungangensis]